MAESTLSLSYQEIRTELADYLGWGRDSSLWDTGKQNKLDSVITRGLRQFYFPPAIAEARRPNIKRAHSWSFLRPEATLTLTVGTDEYDLPDDFGQMGQGFQFDSEFGYDPVAVTGISKIRVLQQTGDSSGVPRLAAIIPKACDGTTTGQRFSIVFYPSPDRAYVLTYQYQVLSHALSATQIYPLGGAAHSETILQSCLAIAEQDYREGSNVQYAKFLDRLSASVEFDKRAGSCAYMGSLNRPAKSATRNRPYFVVTVDGVGPE